MNDNRAAYDVDFDWDEPHGRLVRLLSERPERGVVVDLGCGYAAHADVVREAGFTYAGFDVDAVAVASVNERGFFAATLDLSDVAATLAALDDVVASHDEPVVAVMALDVFEHLVEPHVLLAQLSPWCAANGDVALALSVPNASHIDVAAKLLAGRWDVTETGLLDHTHLRFFTPTSFDALMDSTGWELAESVDRDAVRSDQQWPTGSPFVGPGARLNDMLRRARAATDDHAITYQFVRRYVPAGGSTHDRTTIGLALQPPAEPTVALSVLIDPSCPADEIAVIENTLEAQTSDDWELVITPTMVAGLAQVNGRHVALLGPGDRVQPGWVSQFVDASIGPDQNPVAAVLRCDVADASPAPGSAVMTHEFGNLDHARPTHAFPTEALRALRLADRVDADRSLPATVTMLLGAVPYCGIVHTAVPAVSVCGTVEIDADVLAASVADLDAAPVLLSPGTLDRVDTIDRARLVAESRAETLATEVERLRAENDELNQALRALPVRIVRRIFRR